MYTTAVFAMQILGVFYIRGPATNRQWIFVKHNSFHSNYPKLCSLDMLAVKMVIFTGIYYSVVTVLNF